MLSTIFYLSLYSFLDPALFHVSTGFYDSTDGSIKTHAPLGNAIGRKNGKAVIYASFLTNVQ